MSIKLLLADPHAVALRGWRQFLAGSDIEIVAETSDSSQVLTLIQQFSPEVAMIAVEMHGRSGLALLAEIKQCRPQLPVLLTACQDHAAQAPRLMSSRRPPSWSRAAAARRFRP